jgi:hypothetical protein
MASARRRIGVGCAGLLAALGISFLVLLYWRARVDRQLDAAWRQRLGGESFLERYPATEDNGTVLALGRLGAEIGIDFAPSGAAGPIVRPAAEAAARYASVSEALRRFNHSLLQAEEAPAAAPSPELVAFAASVRPGVDRIVQLLLREPKPDWRRDLALGVEQPIPNWLGPLGLNRLLVLEARLRLEEGKRDEADSILEAGWRLTEAVRANSPLLISQLIGQAMLRSELALLREGGGAPRSASWASLWRPRLAGLDLGRKTLIALQAECFGSYQAARREWPLGRETRSPVPRWVVRWALWDYSRRCHRAFADLETRDVRTFDADAFFEELKEKYIPRWHTVGRLLLPNFLDAWPKAVRRELEAELTALVLEEGDRLARGGPGRGGDRRPSRVRGLSWVYAETPEAVTIGLDGDLRQKDSTQVIRRYSLRKAPSPELARPPDL